MNLIEYLKRSLGEFDTSIVSITNEELKMLIETNVISNAAGEDIQLQRWGSSGTVYRAPTGLGCWLDNPLEIMVDDESMLFDEYQIDCYLGEVIFNKPPKPEAVVIARVWRVDYMQALSQALLWLANDYARNAVNANIEGISCDFTNVARELRAQSLAVRTQSGPVKLIGNDFPH